MGTQSAKLPAPRSRFFILSIFFALFPALLYSSAWAQSEIKITGQVIDSVSGNPIPGAIIEIHDIAKQTYTDSRGQFVFIDMPSGKYVLGAKRLGYHEIKDIAVDVGLSGPAQITIRMSAEPLEIGGQTVYAPRQSKPLISSKSGVTIIDLPSGGVQSIENLVEQIPQLQLVESGPRKLLRIRGAQLNATAILLDGHNINSTLSSDGDISTIPLSSVTRIEIMPGGNYKSGGLSGSINFITKSIAESAISSSVERGSYDFESYSLQLSRGGRGNIRALLDGASAFTRGDFKFTDPRDSVQTRQNNYHHDQMLFGKLEYEDAAISGSLKARYFHRSAGIPGQTLQLTPQANSDNREQEIYANAVRKFARGLALSLDGGMLFRRADLDSPRTPTTFIAYKTRFDEQTRDIKVGLQKDGAIKYDTYVSLRHEQLDGADLIRPSSSFGKHARTANAVGAGATLDLPRLVHAVKSSNVTAGFKREDGGGKAFWAPSATLRINANLPFSPGIDFSYYRARRLPDMTDLYWKEDVFATPNPDLLPEKSRGYNLGFDLKGERYVPFNLRASRFETNYDDIIIWRKWAGDKFKPVNLSSARISGYEVSMEARPFSGPVEFAWNAAFIKPLNKESEPTHHDKYLTFRPLSSQNARLQFEMGGINAVLAYRLIGKRYTTEENTKALDAIGLYDFSVEYNLNIAAEIAARLSFSALNIGNVQYELLDRQPERPREFKLKLTLSKTGSIL